MSEIVSSTELVETLQYQQTVSIPGVDKLFGGSASSLGYESLKGCNL